VERNTYRGGSVLEKEREDLLYLFANFWAVIAVVMLVPFLLTWRRGYMPP